MSEYENIKKILKNIYKNNPKTFTLQIVLKKFS